MVMLQVSITSKGRRADSYRQFLEPVLDRDNLTVVYHAQTKRVVIDNKGGKPRAVGVEIQSIQVRHRQLGTECHKLI
jgi:choline dehydrogenase-like flavoprotein